MRRVNVRKRGKVYQYQYQFEIGTINGKRKLINKSVFKTQNETVIRRYIKSQGK